MKTPTRPPVPYEIVRLVAGALKSMRAAQFIAIEIEQLLPTYKEGLQSCAWVKDAPLATFAKELSVTMDNLTHKLHELKGAPC